MKVIFLDIDGVLCSMRSAIAHGGYPQAANTATWNRFDRTAIALLRTAIDQTGAEIVLSSKWREEVNIPTLEYCLGIKILDTTRISIDKEIRGAQIADWLASNPDVTRYAILDDDEDMMPAQMDHLCRTSKRNGFLIGHYDELIELLS